MKMKRILSLVLALALVFSLAMSVTAFAEETRTVTFYTDANMTEIFTTQIVEYRGYATKPDPDPEPYTVGGYRYEFDKWYRNGSNGVTIFEFESTKIRNDIDLFAGYTQYLAEGWRLMVVTPDGVAFITDTTTPISDLLKEYPVRESVTLEQYEEGGGDTHVHNYDYDHSVWNWAEDYSSATVSINCLNEPTHTETVDATVTVETTPATCTETGLDLYTANADFNDRHFTETVSIELPLAEHELEFQDAEWDENEEGEFGAYFAYKCSVCGHECEEFVLPESHTDVKGWRTYVATDRFGNTVSSDPMQLFFTVVFNGEAQPTQYVWGDICLLASADQEVKAWYLVTEGAEALIADGVSSYSFVVTDNTTIVTEETEHHEPQAAVAVTLRSETVGTAVFNAMWSIPKGAEVQSAMIYRGYTVADKDVSAETLVSKGTPYDTKLLATSGSFRLNLSGLDATRYQHVMIRITYTLGEEEMILDSAVKRVLPTGEVV